jgi:hypothetical protein
VHALTLAQPPEQLVEARVLPRQYEDLGGLKEHDLDVVCAIEASDAGDGELPVERRLRLATHGAEC